MSQTHFSAKTIAHVESEIGWVNREIQSLIETLAHQSVALESCAGTMADSSWERSDLFKRLAAISSTMTFCEQELETQKNATGCAYPVPDPSAPDRAHVVRGTRDGIKALEAALRQRFRDGVELGQMMAGEHVDALNAVIRQLDCSGESSKAGLGESE